MFLLIDNFDSFTFNLVQAFQGLGQDPVVLRNDRPELLDLAASGKLTRVCLSPGPSRRGRRGPVPGVPPGSPTRCRCWGCAGHQTLGHFARGRVEVADRIMHGKTSQINPDGAGLFTGLPSPFELGPTTPCVKADEPRREARKLLRVTASHLDRASHGPQIRGPALGRGAVPPPGVGAQHPLGPKTSCEFREQRVVRRTHAEHAHGRRARTVGVPTRTFPRTWRPRVSTGSWTGP